MYALSRAHSHLDFSVAAYIGYMKFGKLHQSTHDPPEFTDKTITFTVKAYQSLTESLEKALQYFCRDDRGIFECMIHDDLKENYGWLQNEAKELLLKSTEEDGVEVPFCTAKQVVEFAKAIRHLMLTSLFPNDFECEIVNFLLTPLPDTAPTTGDPEEERWVAAFETHFANIYFTKRIFLQMKVRQFWRINRTTLHCIQRLDKIDHSIGFR